MEDGLETVEDEPQSELELVSIGITGLQDVLDRHLTEMGDAFDIIGSCCRMLSVAAPMSPASSNGRVASCSAKPWT